jgi:hypothetical protein
MSYPRTTLTTPAQCIVPILCIVYTRSKQVYAKRIFGDDGAGVEIIASSAALDKERYAVHAIPTVETNGCADHQ